MRRFVLIICFCLISTSAFAWGNVLCVNAPGGDVTCFVAVNKPQFTDAETATNALCRNRFPGGEFTICNHPVADHDFRNLCAAVFTNSQKKPFLVMEPQVRDAIGKSFAQCVNSEHAGFSCRKELTECDIDSRSSASSQPLEAKKSAAVACGRTPTDPVVCSLTETTYQGNNPPPPAIDPIEKCHQAGITDCRIYSVYSGACHGIAATADGRTAENSPFDGTTSNVENARLGAIHNCNARYQVNNCHNVVAFCANPDPVPAPAPTLAKTTTVIPPANPPSLDETHSFDFLSDPDFYRVLFIGKIIEDVRTGIGVGLGILIVLLAFANRARIINFVIHGNLPYKLAAYADDVEVLFKRTQRVNWYGRVVFGLTTRLGLAANNSKDKLGDQGAEFFSRFLSLSFSLRHSAGAAGRNMRKSRSFVTLTNAKT